MRLIVKHVVQTKAGTYTYRRRVPKGVCEVLGKTEIKKALGKSQSQALKHYQSFHREVERLLKSAQRAAASKTVAPRTEYEVHREALRRLQDIGFDEIKGFGLGDDEDEDLHREVVSDSIADQYPIDPNTGGPTGLLRFALEIDCRAVLRFSRAECLRASRTWASSATLPPWKIRSVSRSSSRRAH